MSETMTARQTAELIAKFRTPPGFNWKPLADDIETALVSFYKRGRDHEYELSRCIADQYKRAAQR